MIERELLFRVYSVLAEAAAGDRHLRDFLGSLNDGSFFELPPERQLDTLRSFDEAYLGRGDLISGLLSRGLVSKSLPDEMVIANLWYLLTLDLPESQKAAMRNGLARMQCQLPE